MAATVAVGIVVILGDVFVARHRHHTEMPDVFRAADAYLTTATTTGSALWEAMASGCPPIALTRTGAEHAIVNGGYDANGWIADARTEYLAAAIAQVCIAPAERGRRGAAAATWARRHLR
ncbi:glycosyltransferase [Kitasatospora sp. NPDC057015]|uniref:glycosyltransferase n=1 Tax=Kitasatospora sp. NPDC057015 TaxID=3346001 RepID=UPI003627EAE6